MGERLRALARTLGRARTPVEVALRWPIPADQDVVVIHLISDDFLYGTSLAVYVPLCEGPSADLRPGSGRLPSEGRRGPADRGVGGGGIDGDPPGAAQMAGPR
jgi:hypothetical protein